MKSWTCRRYNLWVINTETEAFLFKWDNWRFLMPSVDKLLQLTSEKGFIRTFQCLESENKWLGFGRMIWNEENNVMWTTKYRTLENEPSLQFYGTEVWAPDWNQFYKSGTPPDLFVKLYHYKNSNTTKEGLIIAIPRKLNLKQKLTIDRELLQLRMVIPNSSLTMITRLWHPWFRFVNNIEDMNPQELEKIVGRGKK